MCAAWPFCAFGHGNQVHPPEAKKKNGLFCWLERESLTATGTWAATVQCRLRTGASVPNVKVKEE